jgi:hypothetical protein
VAVLGQLKPQVTRKFRVTGTKVSVTTLATMETWWSFLCQILSEGA